MSPRLEWTQWLGDYYGMHCHVYGRMDDVSWSRHTGRSLYEFLIPSWYLTLVYPFVSFTALVCLSFERWWMKLLFNKLLLLLIRWFCSSQYWGRTTKSVGYDSDSFFFLKCYRSFSPYAHLSLVPRVSLLSVRGSVLHGHSFSLSNAHDKTKNIFIYFLYHL